MYSYLLLGETQKDGRDTSIESPVTEVVDIVKQDKKPKKQK